MVGRVRQTATAIRRRNMGVSGEKVVLAPYSASPELPARSASEGGPALAGASGRQSKRQTPTNRLVIDAPAQACDDGSRLVFRTGVDHGPQTIYRRFVRGNRIAIHPADAAG